MADTGKGPLLRGEAALLAGERELEALRSALRREVAVHRNLAGLAREVGVGRIVLRKFLALATVPTPEHLQAIRDWAENRPPVAVPLSVVMLAALTRELAAGERLPVRRALAEVLAGGHQRSGAAIPGWLRFELELDSLDDRQGRRGRQASSGGVGHTQ
jgi:hypothetical protein